MKQKTQHTPLAEGYLRLYREQFRDLARLMEEREFARSQNHSETVLSRRVDRLLEELSGGPRGLGRLEKSLNIHFDGVLDKLKADLPQLSEADYRLFCCFAAGLPSEVCCLLLGLGRHEVLYLRKHRLIRRILLSRSPHKELYLQLLSHTARGK